MGSQARGCQAAKAAAGEDHSQNDELIERRVDWRGAGQQHSGHNSRNPDDPERAQVVRRWNQTGVEGSLQIGRGRVFRRCPKRQRGLEPAGRPVDRSLGQSFWYYLDATTQGMPFRE